MLEFLLLCIFPPYLLKLLVLSVQTGGRHGEAGKKGEERGRKGFWRSTVLSLFLPLSSFVSLLEVQKPAEASV